MYYLHLIDVKMSKLLPATDLHSGVIRNFLRPSIVPEINRNKHARNGDANIPFRHSICGNFLDHQTKEKENSSGELEKFYANDLKPICASKKRNCEQQRKLAEFFPAYKLFKCDTTTRVLCNFHLHLNARFRNWLVFAIVSAHA